MSISALSGSDTSAGLAEMMQAAKKNAQPSSDDFAKSIVEQDDTDGDGLLSLDETPLDQDRFNEIDTDGDGFVSQDELSADASKNMTAGGMPTQSSGSETAAASSSGSSESSEEDYDTYDLNEDGVVSLDELLQAFKKGDESLSSLFESLDNGTASATTQRLAMEAYQAQATSEQLIGLSAHAETSPGHPAGIRRQARFHCISLRDGRDAYSVFPGTPHPLSSSWQAGLDPIGLNHHFAIWRIPCLIVSCWP